MRRNPLIVRDKRRLRNSCKVKMLVEETLVILVDQCSKVKLSKILGSHPRIVKFNQVKKL
jgi:hypothetical protein